MSVELSGACMKSWQLSQVKEGEVVDTSRVFSATRCKCLKASIVHFEDWVKFYQFNFKLDQIPRKPYKYPISWSLPFIPSRIKYSLKSFIVIADVEGSLEALVDIIETYNSPLCKLDVVHFDVGAVSKNDIELAESFDGMFGIINLFFFYIIREYFPCLYEKVCLMWSCFVHTAVVYNFNVDVPPEISQLAEKKNISIRPQNIIYRFLEDVRNEMNARLPEKEMEEITGNGKWHI